MYIYICISRYSVCIGWWEKGIVSALVDDHTLWFSVYTMNWVDWKNGDDCNTYIIWSSLSCDSNIISFYSTYFGLLLLNQKANWLNLGRKHRVICKSKIAKIVPIGNPRWLLWGHLENLFFTSSPEPKGQLIWNLVGSIGMTCRLKIAKIVPIGNPRWPAWWPSWKSIFRFFWTKMPIDLKLGRKHLGDL